jgi:hypothetical protein
MSHFTACSIDINDALTYSGIYKHTYAVVKLGAVRTVHIDFIFLYLLLLFFTVEGFCYEWIGKYIF